MLHWKLVCISINYYKHHDGVAVWFERDSVLCIECHKTESLWNHTATDRKEGEQLEDQRSVGESSCNCGDGTEQRVRSLMFMTMMMTVGIPDTSKLRRVIFLIGRQEYTCKRSSRIQNTASNWQYWLLASTIYKQPHLTGALVLLIIYIYIYTHTHTYIYVYIDTYVCVCVYIYKHKLA